MTTRKKTNILLIMSDQHAAWATGAYGHPFVQSPNIDAIAANGVVFDNAYCNSPICGPSRASFMTGRLPHSIGVLTNSTPMRSDLPTWAHYLSIAGYQTALAGKMHFTGPDQKHGFELRFGDEVHTTRIRPASMVMSKNRHDLQRFFRAGPGRNKYIDHDDEVTSNVTRYLQGENRDTTRPFAICANYFLPHFPFEIPDQYFYRYYPEHASLPELPPGYLENQHPAWKAQRAFYDMDSLDRENMRRAVAAYYGMCTFLDDQIGKLLQTLESTGLAENTIVVYTSDHGEHLGRHGLWLKKTFFEESVRVPLMVSWAGRFPRGERRTQVVSLVDLAAALVEWADGPEPYRMDGRSLAPLVGSASHPWVDLAISEFIGVDEKYLFTQVPVAGAPRRMVRDGRYKLNYFAGERPELYDMEADPGEWHDLGSDPAYAAVVGQLSARATADWNPDDIIRQVEDNQKRCWIIMEAESAYLGDAPRPMHLMKE